MEAATEDIYGIIASMLGIEATDAADQDLIMSSSFPMLKIEKVVEVTLTSYYGNQYTLYNHNLGYPPFFLLYQKINGALIHKFTSDTIDTTNNAIRLFDFTGNFNGTTPQTRTFVLVICRNPLNRALSTSVFRTQSIAAALRDRTYGLVVAKEGKSADSEDMRDFTFHSNARSLLVHTVDYRQAMPDGSGGQSVTWTNNLPYRPIFFGFMSTDNGLTYRLLYGGEQSPPGVSQNTAGDVWARSFDPGDGTKHYASIWVFKDPFDIGASESVIV